MTHHVVVQPDIWTILTAVGTVVALLSIIVALYFNRRSLARDRKNGEATAARAEAAARLSAESHLVVGPRYRQHVPADEHRQREGMARQD